MKKTLAQAVDSGRSAAIVAPLPLTRGKREERVLERGLWSSLDRHGAFIRRKLGRRRSNAIALGFVHLSLDSRRGLERQP